eukprot:3720502-Amphidinium_carterae.1
MGVVLTAPTHKAPVRPGMQLNFSTQFHMADGGISCHYEHHDQCSPCFHHAGVGRDSVSA